MDVGRRGFRVWFLELGGARSDRRRGRSMRSGLWSGFGFVRAAGAVGEALFERFAEAVENGEDWLSEFLEWGMDRG